MYPAGALTSFLVDKTIQMIMQAKMDFPKLPNGGNYILSANLRSFRCFRCFPVFLVKLKCQKRNVALNSVKRPKMNGKGLKSRTPKQIKRPCTAGTAQELSSRHFSNCGNLLNRRVTIQKEKVNKYFKLPNSEKIAKFVADFSTAAVGFFSQFEATNSEQKRATGFCLLSSKILLKKLLKQLKVVEPNTTHLEMPAILTKLAKFKAKLLAEEESSDREEAEMEAEMEPKVETELDIPMSTISYEETDDSDRELPIAEMSKELDNPMSAISY